MFECDGCDTRHPDGTGCTIPAAPFYVTFSFDGPGSWERIVVPCPDEETAQATTAAVRDAFYLIGDNRRARLLAKAPAVWASSKRRLFVVFKPEQVPDLLAD